MDHTNKNNTDHTARTRNVAKAEIVGNRAVHYITLVIWLFLFWLVISGEYNAKFLAIGIVASFIVAWICLPLLLISNASGTKKYFALSIHFPAFLVYAIWLLKELIISNIDVVRAVWRGREAVEPVMLRFRVRFDNPLAIIFLANSITLTPGTATVNVTNGNIYEIHALTPEAAEGIRAGNVVKKVAKLFHEDPAMEMIGEVSS